MISRADYLSKIASNPVAGALLEAEIDVILGRTKPDYDNRVCISLSALGNPHRLILEAVLQRYRDGGWQIKRWSDQREGDWLEFRL